MAFLTINETAKTPGFSRYWGYRTINADPTFPAWRLGGHWRIDSDKLQAWISDQPGSGPQISSHKTKPRKYQLNIPKGAYSPF